MQTIRCGQHIGGAGSVHTILHTGPLRRAGCDHGWVGGGAPPFSVSGVLTACWAPRHEAPTLVTYVTVPFEVCHLAPCRRGLRSPVGRAFTRDRSARSRRRGCTGASLVGPVAKGIGSRDTPRGRVRVPSVRLGVTPGRRPDRHDPNTRCTPDTVRKRIQQDRQQGGALPNTRDPGAGGQPRGRTRQSSSSRPDWGTGSAGTPGGPRQDAPHRPQGSWRSK